MNCPHCGSDDTGIYRTIKTPNFDLRHHKCNNPDCGTIWSGTEPIDKNSIRVGIFKDIDPVKFEKKTY